MVVVLKRWDSFAGLLAVFVVLSAGLYWFWFRHLAESTISELNASEAAEPGSMQGANALPET
jgi:hypothetical protein